MYTPQTTLAPRETTLDKVRARLHLEIKKVHEGAKDYLLSVSLGPRETVYFSIRQVQNLRLLGEKL